VSPLRPDLIDCWIFRIREADEVEILLLRRAPGRILPGLWQCVSGSVEAGERVAMAALREVEEETGFGPASIEAFFDLDLVNAFHEPSIDAVAVSAVFAVRVAPDREARLSHEHDGMRWVTLDAAWREVIWPGYRTAIEHLRDFVLDPARAAWFRLGLDGSRIADATDGPR
jgi:8-oxo-dGTP pyrophosphatase MutT (NUDIX family)